MKTIKTVVSIVVVTLLVAAGLWISSLLSSKTTIKDKDSSALVWRRY